MLNWVTMRGEDSGSPGQQSGVASWVDQRAKSLTMAPGDAPASRSTTVCVAALVRAGRYATWQEAFAAAKARRGRAAKLRITIFRRFSTEYMYVVFFSAPGALFTQELCVWRFACVSVVFSMFLRRVFGKRDASTAGLLLSCSVGDSPIRSASTPFPTFALAVTADALVLRGPGRRVPRRSPELATQSRWKVSSDFLRRMLPLQYAASRQKAASPRLDTTNTARD